MESTISNKSRRPSTGDSANAGVKTRPAPGPSGATTIDELAQRLRQLREWVGQPSYRDIADRIRRQRSARGLSAAEQRVGRSTVYDLFRSGRARLDVELLVEVVGALGVPPGDAEDWRRVYGAAVSRPEPLRLIDVAGDLPSPVPYFTGRSTILDRVVCAAPGTTSILVGMAGVGKTQLALRAAAHHASVDEMRPVYVGLRGSNDRHSRIPPDDLLVSLLRFAGVEPATLRNMSLAERVVVWSRWISQQRAVIVLDDAYDAAQIRSLIPPDHEGRVLVTSRRTITGIENTDVVALEPLAPEESIAFLGHVAGTGEFDDDLAVGRIAELCGHLPLELAATAAILAERCGWTLDDHVRRLEASPRGARVRPALGATTDELSSDEHCLFRRLALHPSAFVAPWSAAALADLPVAHSVVLLDTLARVHLLRPVDTEATVHRFVLHDLVREHAAEMLREHDPYHVQRESVRRLSDSAASLVRSSVDSALPHADFPRRDGIDPAPSKVGSAQAALEWLGGERVMLVDLIDRAMSFDLPESAASIAAWLAPYLDFSGHTALSIGVLELGLATPDETMRAVIHRHLALAHERHGHFEAVVDHLQQALKIAPDSVPGRSLTLMGGAYTGLGRLHDALECHRAARAEIDPSDLARTARAATNIGTVLRLLGEFDGAESEMLDAIAAFRQAGDDASLILVYGNLGLVYADMGRDDAAVEYLQRATELATLAGTERIVPRADAGCRHQTTPRRPERGPRTR